MQLVPEQISRRKFDRQVASLRAAAAQLRQRGWTIVSTEFPVVEVAFLPPKTEFRHIHLTARVDFTDYDLRPPSVKFIDVLTGRVMRIEEVRDRMLRRDPSISENDFNALVRSGQQVPAQPMLMGVPGQEAFLCLQGVREYHETPAHTGDDWLLYRGGNKGTLFHILEQISRYGSECYTGINVLYQLQPSRTAVVL